MKPVAQTRPPVACPYCGAVCVIRDSAMIYGRSFGKILVCSRYPHCDSYVGCHARSGEPKGTPANAELRKLRSLAHAAFDPLWTEGRKSRTEAYDWLARKLGIPRGECHIGFFDEATCRRVIEVCPARRAVA